MIPKISTTELQQFATNDQEEIIIRIGAGRLWRTRSAKAGDKITAITARQLVNQLVLKYLGIEWQPPSNLSVSVKAQLGWTKRQ